MRRETAGFTKASHEYERGRPGYPAQAVRWIVERAGLGPGKTVVDLAAGTGKLTRELVASGAEVVAVEPLAEMRDRLAEQLPHVRAVAGRAEASGLESGLADAITVAQAFHWFANEEALEEMHRLLRPGSLLFLVWNRRQLEDPLQASISRLTLPHLKDAPSYGSGEWRRVMGKSPLFAPDGEHQSTFSQPVDRERLVDRVASTSYIAELPDEVRLPLLEEVALLVGEGEVAELAYTTDVFAYKRR